MPTFSRSLLHLMTALGALSALVGCNLPTPQSRDDLQKNSGVANFSLQAMAEKSRALETLVQGNFDLPASKVFNFVACAKDIAYDKAIVGHDFMVVENNTKMTSDKAGCVTWSENINYNVLGEPRFVRIDRTVKGLGVFKGTQKVSYAINPWLDSANVLNPEDGNEIPGLIDDAEKAASILQGFSYQGTSVQRPLWVEDGRAFISEKQLTAKGIILSVEMRPNPSIVLTKPNGDTYQRPLTAGVFKARMKLIHVYVDEKNQEVRRLLSESPLLDVNMGSGSLAIRSDMTLTAIPTRGQLMLGLELTPVGAPEQMKPFEGVYMLAEYDQIKSTLLLKVNTAVVQDPNFKVSEFLTANLPALNQNEWTGEVQQDMYQKPKVEVAQLEFRYIGTGQETTNTREVIYNVKACLRHGLDQKAIRSQTFQIKKFQAAGLDTRSLTTDNNSCLFWDEKITYNYFECQRYLQGSIHIVNDVLGMKEEIPVVLNPWDLHKNPAAVRDARYTDPRERFHMSCDTRPRTQIFMDSYYLNALSYEYAIDNYLNLTMHKKMHFRIDPRLMIPSSGSEGRDDNQKLRDGAYLLRLAVVKNRDYDQQRNTLVTAVDKLVTVINGQVNTEVVFKTQDFKALGNRNNLLVEIYPVDANKVKIENGQVALKDPSQALTSAIDTTSTLETPTFIGPVVLNMDDPARALRQLDTAGIAELLLNGQGRNEQNGKNVIAAVVAQGAKEMSDRAQVFAKRADRTAFVKENNLDLINLKTADEQQPLIKSLVGSTSLREELMVTKKDLQEIISKGTISPAVAKKLCTFWSADYYRRMYEKKGGAMGRAASSFGWDCLRDVEKDPSKFFLVEKHLLVKEVGPSQYLKGYNHVMNLGTSFSLSNAHSTYFTRSTSVAAKAGISKKFLDIFSFGLDVAYTLSWATSDANSTSNSVSVGSNTQLLVQQNQFQIRVNKHEQCAIVRLNPVLFVPNSNFFFTYDYLGHLNPNLTEEEMTVAATRGLFLCEGEVKSQAKNITESYYLIAQETSSTQIQDSGDARNRNFFLALRSSHDFKRFVLGVRGEIDMPQNASTGNLDHEDAMVQTHELLKAFSPTYPAMFREK